MTIGTLSLHRRLPPRLYLLLLPSLFAIALGLAMLLGTDHRPAVLPLLLLAVAAPQELFFRAYLLPRTPLHGTPAILASGLLSALPFALSSLFPYILVMHLVLTAVTVRFGSVRLGIAAHCLLALAVLVA
ncbi:CPBP family glutamic-type intramembrane protease [Dactylosporangium sp. CA-152071]|uniref:CPBP family glutamic-type intramembrane protease n=1 Tax=Dactylosporangium sp. CA-152071 TaxID=3239933 RepID=UPI003D907165